MVKKVELIKTLNKVFLMSSKELWIKKLEKWPSIVLILLAWGGVILLSEATMKITLAIDNSVKGYLYTGLLIFIGILIVIFSSVLGSFLYEANRRQLTWLCFWRNDEELKKDFQNSPYASGSTIWIIRIVGIGVILIAVSSVLGF